MHPFTRLFPLLILVLLTSFLRPAHAGTCPCGVSLTTQAEVKAFTCMEMTGGIVTRAAEDIPVVDLTSLSSLAMVAGDSDAAQAPETERQPPALSQQVSPKWTISVIRARAELGGAGLKDAMKTLGYGKTRRSCFLSCNSTTYPFSRSRAGWLFEIRYAALGRAGIGLLVSHIGWETVGYNAGTYLTVAQSVTTYAPVLSLQASPWLRLGVGPAMHRTSTWGRNDNSVGDPEDARRLARLGLAADLAITFGLFRPIYVDLRAQYRGAGSDVVGPFRVTNMLGTEYAFPARRAGFSHVFVGAGLAARF